MRTFRNQQFDACNAEVSVTINHFHAPVYDPVIGFVRTARKPVVSSFIESVGLAVAWSRPSLDK